MWDWLRRVICNLDSEMPEPQGLEFIESFEILSILSAAYPDIPFYLSDHQYKTTTKEELMRFLKYDMVDAYKYTSEYYDCDDFSFALMGHLSNPKWGCLPFGIMWVTHPYGAHAVNFFIDVNREIWVIEPQSDEIYGLPEDWKPYLVIM